MRSSLSAGIRCEQNEGPAPERGPFFDTTAVRSALGELEALARLGAAVLLSLHHAGIAGQYASALQHRAQARLVERQRLGDAVAHRSRLTGEAAALHRADDVELIAAGGDQERLGEDHAQHRPGEVDRLVLAVHGDLAGARLDPDAGHGVLALAGGVGAALRVALRLGGGSLGLRGHARGSSQLTQIAQGLSLVGHAYWLLLFFGFIASRSSTCGCCASWGCSAPA